MLLELCCAEKAFPLAQLSDSVYKEKSYRNVEMY